MKITKPIQYAFTCIFLYCLILESSAYERRGQEWIGACAANGKALLLSPFGFEYTLARGDGELPMVGSFKEFFVPDYGIEFYKNTTYRQIPVMRCVRGSESAVINNHRVMEYLQCQLLPENDHFSRCGTAKFATVYNWERGDIVDPILEARNARTAQTRMSNNRNDILKDERVHYNSIIEEGFAIEREMRERILEREKEIQSQQK